MPEDPEYMNCLVLDTNKKVYAQYEKVSAEFKDQEELTRKIHGSNIYDVETVLKTSVILAGTPKNIKAAKALGLKLTRS